MKIAICERAGEIQEELKRLVEAISFQYRIDFRIDSFSSGKNVLDALLARKHPYDLIFLSETLEGLSGIEVMRRIRKVDQKIPVIFLANSLEFVLEGYDLRISNYLLKPLNTGKIKDIILEHYQMKYDKSSVFTFNTHHTLHAVPMEDINYFEVYKRIIYLRVTQNKEIEGKGFYKKIEDLADELAAHHFIRCHRSYVVNLKNIASITQNEVVFNNNQRVPISKRMYKAIKDNFLMYNGSSIA